MPIDEAGRLAMPINAEVLRMMWQIGRWLIYINEPITETECGCSVFMGVFGVCYLAPKHSH